MRWRSPGVAIESEGGLRDTVRSGRRTHDHGGPAGGRSGPRRGGIVRRGVGLDEPTGARGEESLLGVSIGPVDRKKRVRFHIPPAPWASGTYFVSVGLDSPDGRLFHVQTQHYPLTVPDVDHLVMPLAVRPTVEVEDL